VNEGRHDDVIMGILEQEFASGGSGS